MYGNKQDQLHNLKVQYKFKMWDILSDNTPGLLNKCQSYKNQPIKNTLLGRERKFWSLGLLAESKLEEKFQKGGSHRGNTLKLA